MFGVANECVMETVLVEKENEAWIKIHADYSILMELADYFSFFVKGYKFMPKFKAGIWDGKLRLFNVHKKLLYAGLFHDVLKFCESREYNIVADDSALADKNATRQRAHAIDGTIH